MLYIEGISYDPYFNLAMEQFVFDHLDRKQEYFIFWQNDNSIIVGKHQNTIQEINMPFVQNNNIKVARRLSGGGAVYHDLGNLNFSYIVDGNNVETLDLNRFCVPIVEALNELGIKANLNGRNDISIDGKKFSGNSQYIKDGRIMHHGTMMYNSNLEIMGKALKIPLDKIQSKGIKSVKSRVTNIINYMNKKVSIDAFKNLLIKHIFKNGIKKYTLSSNDIKAINRIKLDRYAKWEWNFGESPEYNIKKQRRYDGCGKIELLMNIKDGKIVQIEAFGDYFSNKDFKDLARLLIGAKLKREEVQTRISNVDIKQFFCNISIDQFIDLLLM